MDEFDDVLGPEVSLDVKAFLAGDLQGRGRVLYGADRAPVREYLKTWGMSYEDYRRRREVLDSRQYSHFGSCPECEAEGAIYALPWPHGKEDWLVCSKGCEVRWCFGSGHFQAYTPEDLPEEEQAAILEKLESYEEVKPLVGWKLDLLVDLDAGIRMLPAADVGECVVCGFAAIPEDLRKLSGFIFFTAQALPILSLNRQAPLCMVCGEEFSHVLQAAVNRMWWVEHPTGIGKTVSAPHAG